MNESNKRIAKNTIYMYIRLFTTMVIGLYSSRLVLEILGVSDYGLFAVVGGVLAMFTFISSSLAGATSRFLNTEMGKKDGDVNAIFNINLLLHVVLASIIFLLAETVGLWYIYNKLNVADGKLDDAVFIYHVSIVTACLGIINTPYLSLFNAHERFKFTAILDIVNSLVRLGCILMLSLVPFDGILLFPGFSLTLLKLYTLIMMLTTVNTFLVFHYVSFRDWPWIIKRRFIPGWHRYKEVLSFGGWNLLSTVSFMARSSGSDLILNSFFGTAMNGAFAISKSVNQYVTTFSNNFDGASAPQIIQAYAAGDKNRYTYLANKMGKFNLLLFELIFFPLYIELDFILHLWLGSVPEGALVFTQLNLIVAGIALTSGGFTKIIEASGKIKWFKIQLSSFFLLCIPVGYYLFVFGFPAYSMLICFLGADLIQRIIQLVLMKQILHFDSWKYVKEAYVKPTLIAMIMSLFIVIANSLPYSGTYFSVLKIFICMAVTCILVLNIGLNSTERKIILSSVKRKLNIIR